jgi:hypothetical protein
MGLQTMLKPDAFDRTPLRDSGMNSSRPFEIGGYAAVWHAESIDGRDYVLGAGCFGWWLRQALSRQFAV